MMPSGIWRAKRVEISNKGTLFVAMRIVMSSFPVMKRLIALGGALLLMVLSSLPALQAAAETNTNANAPALITADEMSHDQNTGIVMARGNVEIFQDGRTLIADTVRYDVNADRVLASGNVSVTEATGEVYFADKVDLVGEMRDGTARDVRLLLMDDSRMAAVFGERSEGGNINALEKVVYSPCDLCKTNPERAPLWQLKARKAQQDNVAHDIEYTDVVLEMGGVPIFYTPYLSMPDPSVKRRSGFMIPSIGSSTNLGGIVKVPYYWVISPQQDLLLTPILTSKEGPVLDARHRIALPYGFMSTEGSITKDSDDRVRNHIFAKGRFDLTDTWRMGYDVERSSDDTYLRRYQFPKSNESFLTSRLYGEGFWERNYALVESFAYQGLRASDDPGLAPFVMPYGQYHYMGTPDSLGGFWTADASALVITRTGGTDTRRLSSQARWQLPYTSSSGQLLVFGASVRGDLYNFDWDRNNDNTTHNKGRFFPEATVDWRYPFVRRGESSYQTIEPIAQLTLTPSNINPDVPNEDSLDFEFDDTNLFRSQRFTGLDRVEEGPRASYGVRWTWQADSGKRAEALVGQAYHANKDAGLPANSGMDDHFSDYVGRIMFTPGYTVDLLYRFRFDKETFQARRSEVGFSVGPPLLRVSTFYSQLTDKKEKTTTTTQPQEQISAYASSRFSQHWSGGVGGTYDLSTETRGTLNYSMRLTYDDECFTLSTSFQRRYTYDRDLKPDDRVMLLFTFKTLGTVPIAAL